MKLALANLYYVGQGVDQDRKKSAVLSEQSCSQNDAPACIMAATQFMNGDGVQQNNDEALELFKKACELKNETGCQSLSKLQTKLHRYN
jgi:TPR repeat protein